MRLVINKWRKKSEGRKSLERFEKHSFALHNTAEIYRQTFGRQGIREIGCLGKSISFISHPSLQQMSGEESVNGVQHTNSCFMSSHHPEVTAGLSSTSQPFNYWTIYVLYFIQTTESVISATFHWSHVLQGAGWTQMLWKRLMMNEWILKWLVFRHRCVGPLHNGRMAIVVSGLLIWPKYALSQHLEQRRRRLHTETHTLHNSWRLIKELRPLLLRAVVLNHRHDAHILIRCEISQGYRWWVKKHSIFCSSVKRFIKLECFPLGLASFHKKTFEQTKRNLHKPHVNLHSAHWLHVWGQEQKKSKYRKKVFQCGLTTGSYVNGFSLYAPPHHTVTGAAGAG